VAHAVMVGSRQTLIGETLSPRLPDTAAALAAGEIGSGQLRVISETIGSLPASVPEAARQQAEATLAGYACDFDPPAGCASSPTGHLRPWIPTGLNHATSPRPPRGARCGCATAATAASPWKAGWTPSTAPRFAL
jgi:hypothetical protein